MASKSRAYGDDKKESPREFPNATETPLMVIYLFLELPGKRTSKAKIEVSLQKPKPRGKNGKRKGRQSKRKLNSAAGRPLAWSSRVGAKTAKRRPGADLER